MKGNLTLRYCLHQCAYWAAAAGILTFATTFLLAKGFPASQVGVLMACGSIALAMLNKVWEQNKLVSQAFSAQMGETGAAAQKMNEALAAEKLRANTLQSQLFDRIAADFSGQHNAVYFAENLAPGQVRELADKMADHCSGLAAVLSGEEGNYSICIVSRTADVKAIGAALGARGGGKPGFFQGSLRAEKAEIKAKLTELR